MAFRIISAPQSGSGLIVWFIISSIIWGLCIAYVLYEYFAQQMLKKYLNLGAYFVARNKENVEVDLEMQEIEGKLDERTTQATSSDTSTSSSTTSKNKDENTPLHRMFNTLLSLFIFSNFALPFVLFCKSHTIIAQASSPLF